MVSFLPALASGLTTVIVAVSLVVPHALVTCTMYLVVTEGVAIGLATAGLSRPVVGDQR